MPDALLAEVLEAHGGLSRWRGISSIGGRLSSGGLAFASRFQRRALHGLQFRVEPHNRLVRLEHFAGAGNVGTWTPDRVEIRDPGGALLADRVDPRSHLSLLKTSFYWDRLDILYFAGYALWNYLSFPFLLAEPDVEVSSVARDDRGSRLLTARFGPTFPTHSRDQAFHIDDKARLVRHDYTATVYASWASVANFTTDAQPVSGLQLYMRRRVYPTVPGTTRVMPFPLLVWIDLDTVTATPAA